MSISSAPHSWGQELTDYSKDVFWPTVSGTAISGPLGGGCAFAASTGLYMLKRGSESCNPNLKSNYWFKGTYHGANIALPAIAAYHSAPQQCARYAFDVGCKVIKGVMAAVPYLAGNGAGTVVDCIADQNKITPEDEEFGKLKTIATEKLSDNQTEESSTTYGAVTKYAVSIVSRAGIGAIPATLFFTMNSMLYS